MSSYAILTDVTKCIGCEDCVAACKLTHQTGDEDAPWAWQERATDLSSTRWTTIQRTPEGRYVRVHCRHCLDPGCAAACPVGALKVTAEGAVAYNPTICMGCR
jgi:Fe-S-cluster-containing dehydrogenase component